jgi:acyl-CoA hydrolase
MNTVFETTFLVMPEHTNAMSPMIFGGAFFSQMDLCAANTVRRFLYESETCHAAVTHKFEGSFHRPCYMGDLVLLRGEIIETRHKAIVVEVVADRETKQGKERVAEGRFVFVSVTDVENVRDKPALLPYAPHGLSLDADNAANKPCLPASGSDT